MSRHRYVGVVVAVAMAIQFLAPTIASANTGVRAHSNTSRSASSHSRHHVARHSARTITSKTTVNAPTAGGATLTIKKNACDSIGQQNTCNKAQNPSCSSTTGANCYVAVFTVYLGTDNTGTNLGTCTVTLTQSNGAESNQLCSQTLTSGTTYTVCETTQINGFIAFPRPDLSTGGTNESATATCLTFTATSGNAVLQFLDVKAGNLTLCKTAGPGVTSGQVFSFTVTGATIDNTVRTQTVSVAAGSCQTISNFFFAGENVTIQETVPAGGTVTSVVGATTGTTAGSSTLTLVAGANTVTYTNAISGRLQICKTSTGTPAVTGTFSFGVAGQTTTAAVGTCSTILTVPAGSQTITETAPDGSTTLANCLIVQNGLPGPVCTPSGNDVTVNIVGGQTTVVTFTNRVQTGTLQVCKTADNTYGTVSGSFNFTVNGTAAALSTTPGSCVSETLPAGSATVSEDARSGFTLTNCAVTAGTGTCDTNNAAAVTIAANATTTVTFTNQVTPGTLQICKVGDNTFGTVTGTFNFTVNGTADAANTTPGNCTSMLVAPGTTTVSEQARSGFTLTACSVTAGTGSCDTNNAASVTIASGATTTVSFTNQVIPGTLQVCKQSTTAFPVTGTFSFTVDQGTSGAQTLSATVGGCSSTISLSPGTHTITEASTSGTAVTGCTISQNGGTAADCGTALTGNTVTVTIVSSQATVVTFTNTTQTGTLQVCKTGDNTFGTVSGTFSFTVNGAAGALSAAAGSCASMILAPGTATVSEDAKAGFTLTACAVTPTGSGSCNASNVASATITAGATTTVTFTNQVTPAGLQICKAAQLGSGLTGTFTFSVNGTTLSATVGGACSSVLSLAPGTYTVAETGLPTSGEIQMQSAALTSGPAGSSVSNVNATAATFNVTVAGSGTTNTVVTVTNNKVLAIATPVCTIASINTNSSGQTVVTVNLQDLLGFASITTTSRTTNFSTNISSLTLGPTATNVTVIGTQINPNIPGLLEITATDLSGTPQSVTCDPSVGQLRSGRSATVFHNVAFAEHWVTVNNRSHSSETIAMTVNGHRVVLRVAAGHTKTFNIAWALHRGTNNVVTMKVLGKRGNTALAMIHD